VSENDQEYRESPDAVQRSRVRQRNFVAQYPTLWVQPRGSRWNSSRVGVEFLRALHVDGQCRRYNGRRTPTHIISTALGVLTLAIWLYLLLYRGRFWNMRDQSAPIETPPQRRISVVIPARDEADTIAIAVHSLRKQPWPSELEIIVADDNSADDTARLARDAGATVISAGPLQPGWTGKLWAVSQGVEQALASDPDYILLTDADIEHAPDSIVSLVSRAEASRLDLASFMVRLHCDTTAERFLMPAFVYFFLQLYPPAWIARPESPAAGAAGGCILIRPSALARIGGIASIKAELIDDCALARAVKRGGPIWLGLSSTTRSLRVYETFSDVRSMIARTAFTQLRHSPLLLTGTVLGMLLTYAAAPGLVFYGDGIAAALGSVTWLVMCATFIPALRFYRRPFWYAPLLPLIAGFYIFATLESALRYWTGAGGWWKGRAQDVRG
jgi:hopene-associated glycosyltransferase HpnB